MPYDHLSEFLGELQDAGELLRISAEVDSTLEIAGITHRVCQPSHSAPALFFERVSGSPYPVVTNLLGSESRISKALGVASLDELSSRIAALLRPEIPTGLIDTLKRLPQLSQISKLPPRTVRSGACQQVVRLGRDVVLREFPFLQSWPLETSRSLTQTQVFTKHPESEQRDVSRTALIVKDTTTCWLPWSVHDIGTRNFHAYRRQGLRMPVAVALGGDPACVFTAATPFPAGIDPCLAAGFFRGQPLELVKCRSIDLEVPTGAEVVFEGYIDPAEPWEPVGTQGVASGFYSLDALAPLFHVTAITQRANPVVPTNIVGRSSNEDAWIAKATERILLPLLSLMLPEVVDVGLPRCGSKNVLFVSIRKQYPLQARKVMATLWGLAPSLFAKILVVVDEEVDVHVPEDVWFHVAANVHPGRDVQVHDGPSDVWDHSTPIAGMGRAIGFDATRKSAGEGHPRDWPGELLPSKAVQDLLDSRWSEYGLGGQTPATY